MLMNKKWVPAGGFGRDDIYPKFILTCYDGTRYSVLRFKGRTDGRTEFIDLRFGERRIKQVREVKRVYRPEFGVSRETGRLSSAVSIFR